MQRSLKSILHPSSYTHKFVWAGTEGHVWMCTLSFNGNLLQQFSIWAVQVAFPWENSSPLIFCLKTHKSALFVWTGVSSRVVLSIYSPSLALFVYLIRILWLDSLKNEMNEGRCWFVMIHKSHFSNRNIYKKDWLQSWAKVLMRRKWEVEGKVSAPKVHKISICLKSSQERRSRIYHHVRTLLKLLGQHCCCCGKCCK